YLALDSSLQRQVAIKEYLPAGLAMRCDDGQVWVRPNADPAAYAAGMTSFLNEAKLLARFDHPALVRVHSFWEENRSAYMVMPFYEGQTLAAMLADMPRPPEEAWLRGLLAPLLSALSTLHNANCLHLDISPTNIMVQPDDRPVLLDFGVASRLAADKTMPLTALLNPAYAPIEQYSETAALPQGPWTDLYSLASVLHFAIAGVPPARATVRAVEDPQRPLAETVAARAEQFPGLSYSRGFLSAIDKALAVKPRARPRSAAEFQFLLDLRAPPAEDDSFAAAAAAAAAASTQSSPFDSPFTIGPSPTSSSSRQGTAESWFAAEPKDAPARPARSRTPMWIAVVAVLGLAGVGGWTWLQRQPSFANITSADLPPAVVANIPKPVTEGANVESAPAMTVPTPTVTASAVQVAPVSAAAASVPAAASAVLPAPTPAASAPSLAATSTTATAAAPPPAASAAVAAAPAPAPKASTRAAAARERTAAAKPPVKPVAAAPALPPEPNNPRAACGSRSNFALVYCMQQQCKRWKFNTHPQCLEMERRGEL
ncbi:MAG: serine/threonine-protein kinase, partial [Rhizobacter sp.]